MELSKKLGFFLLLALILSGCATMATGLSSNQISKIKNLATLSNQELKTLYYDVCDEIDMNRSEMIGAESQSSYTIGGSMADGMMSGIQKGQHKNLLKIKRAIVKEMNFRGLQIPTY